MSADVWAVYGRDKKSSFLLSIHSTYDSAYQHKDHPNDEIWQLEIEDSPPKEYQDYLWHVQDNSTNDEWFYFDKNLAISDVEYEEDFVLSDNGRDFVSKDGQFLGMFSIKRMNINFPPLVKSASKNDI